ncbi:MAG: hypothetical protein RBQ95_06395, partial [Paracholeplasma sp.]
FLLLGLSLVLAPGRYSAAESEELIDLYPYDQEACLLATSECTQTKLGDSFWDFEYYGHRYHIVRGSARYVKDFSDDDSNGFISPLEMTGTSWNAFASLIINDTEEGVILSTASARTDLTQVVHRMYAYFDADGQLYMFEDHIVTYFIVNDNASNLSADADWRLGTTEEKATYDAAAEDAKPTNMRLAHIRMVLSDTDSDGYVIEPIGYLKWSNVDIVAEGETDPTKFSTIVDGNPDFVTIPAGHTVVSFGTNDRGSLNAKTFDYIKSLPTAMITDGVEPFKTVYTPQPAMFDGITALDDDGSTTGTNIVVDYKASFDLPTSVTASWINMFDEDGLIINQTEKLNYSVEIAQEGVVLETIDFTYDAVEDKYTASAPVTKVDSSEFGAAYTATFKVTNPENQETTYTADIVVGVMPPKFVGVKDRFSDEGVYVDLLEGITADNGYGVDITNTIEVTTPRGFNFYSPKAGVYTINLEFTYNVFIAGLPYELDVNGTVYSYDPAKQLNQDVDINNVASYGGKQFALFTDIEHFTTAATSWGSIIVVVGADGKMQESFSRYDWKHIDETNPTGLVKDEVQFNAWKAALTLEEGEFIMAAHGSTTLAPTMRNYTYDMPMTLTIGTPDLDEDIVKTMSYVLTIDDITPPTLVAVDNKYTVVEGSYASVEDAILANVVAIDNFDSRNDIALFASNLGGMSLSTPGTYNVVVTGEDSAGNSSTVSFQVTVVAKEITEGKVDEKVEDAMDDLKDYVGDNTLTEQQIKDLIEAQEDAVGTSLVVTIVVSLVSAGLAFGAAFFVLKKRP